jgi:2-keto-4-pentenoate hydratase
VELIEVGGRKIAYRRAGGGRSPALICGGCTCAGRVLASAYAGWSLPPEEVEARLTRAGGELEAETVDKVVKVPSKADYYFWEPSA